MPSSQKPLRDRYRLEKILGRGGSGTVFLAQDLISDRPVAVKEICLEASGPQRKAALLEQFRLESQLLQALENPGLPRIHDSFVDEDFCYLVMDYIEGTNLLRLVRERGPVSERTALEWGRQIAATLAYLHTSSTPVILRDLKPSNLMLTREQKIKLIDFGIAKLYDPETGLETRTSARGLLTPGFASPEQYSGGTDPSSDLYSLGATLYYLLTGQIPPDSIDLLTGARELPPLAELRPDVSPATRDMIAQLMILRREDRPGRAELIRDRIGVLLQGGLGSTLSEPLRLSPKLPPPVARRAWKAAALLLFFSACVVPALPRIWGITLQVESDPPNARVFVNSRPVGLTPLEVALPRGTAMVHVAMRDRVAVTETAVLDRGVFRMRAVLEAAQPASENERESYERLLEPPPARDWGSLHAPGYYPPSKGAVPWRPAPAEEKELLGLRYSVPMDWKVLEEQVEGEQGRVVLSALNRNLELVVRTGQDLGPLVDAENALLEAEGWKIISCLVGPQRAVLRYQQAPDVRCVRIYGYAEQRLARLTLCCEPCPEPAYLIQQLDLLRSHVDLVF
ncbi:MAG: serine/threonine protein kinase [Armatimonadetes bacterium]|nr:serine/threonine protein kinase [Armatimonadota bacterium]